MVFVMNELLLHLANKIYTGKSSSSSISQRFLSIACLSEEFEKYPKFNEKPNIQYQKQHGNGSYCELEKNPRVSKNPTQYQGQDQIQVSGKSSFCEAEKDLDLTMNLNQCHKKDPIQVYENDPFHEVEQKPRQYQKSDPLLAFRNDSFCEVEKKILYVLS